MNNKATIIGCVLALFGVFLIAQNPTQLQTGCWDGLTCNYYGRGFVWTYSHSFGLWAWVGVFLNAAGAIFISRGYLPETAGAAIRVFFAILVFLFAMACGIMTLINRI